MQCNCNEYIDSLTKLLDILDNFQFHYVVFRNIHNTLGFYVSKLLNVVHVSLIACVTDTSVKKPRALCVYPNKCNVSPRSFS